MTTKEIPFDFVLEYLYPLDITIKSMFGMKAVYCGETIFLMLRDTVKNPNANGIWVAVAEGQRENLRRDIPALTIVESYKNKKSISEWQLLKPDDPDFERSAILVCDLIKKGDIRVGRVPKKQKTKGSGKRKAAR